MPPRSPTWPRRAKSGPSRSRALATIWRSRSLSSREGRDEVGDLDCLVVSEEVDEVMDRLELFPERAETIARGDTKMSIRLRKGLQIDLRVVPAESFGAALQYFTGSKDHNVVVR